MYINATSSSIRFFKHKELSCSSAFLYMDFTFIVRNLVDTVIQSYHQVTVKAFLYFKGGPHPVVTWGGQVTWTPLSHC